MNDRQAQLSAEALHQLRWQQQWLQAIAQAPPDAPVLTSPNDRLWFPSCLDMVRAAGAEVSQAFYRRGSIIPTSREEGREAASISLKALVTDITRALAYFTDDADKEPGETEPTEAQSSYFELPRLQCEIRIRGAQEKIGEVCWGR